MNKFSTASTLLQFILKKSYPDELKKNLVLAMQTVEQCNAGDNNSSCIVIAESEAERQEVEDWYRLNDFYPETDEYIALNNQRWRKRVYVFGDYGNGIVFYSNAPSDNEKRNE